MPPFTPCFPTSLRPDEVPVALLDLVQERLAGQLSPRFTVVLGAVGTGFIERLLRMATQLKAMHDSATFSSMGSDDQRRPLVWIGELASPREMITMHAPT